MFELNKGRDRAIMPINDFANMCGYFYNAYLRDGISVNNGYNCSHPKCEEVQEGVGECFEWACPFGWEADEEDCQEFGWEYEEGEFIVIDNRDIIKKLIESKVQE